ncbi:MAG: hypothetical protein AAF800_08925 [Planctomycetota bacterium]
MSAKYRRIKQTDEALPAPLRWLTRAFSSITLAVILLLLVSFYGALGSVPLYFICIGLAWLVIFGGLVGAVAWGSVRLANAPDWSGKRKLALGGGALLAAIAAAALLCWEAYLLIGMLPVFEGHKQTILYRLPAIEKNEIEFFAWWPLQVLLILFIINMVWATVRRIEFSFPRLGVLMVHTGIVLIALGSVFYGRAKLEGDMFIVRADLPGAQPVSHFYDRVKPAVFVSVDRAPSVQFVLPELPRYNDYAIGELDIRLHERPEFRDRFLDGLRITIPGFIAYGELEPTWVEAPAESRLPRAGPALTVAMGDRDLPGNDDAVTLPFANAAERVLSTDAWEVEYLHAPSPQRLDDLLSEAPADAMSAPYLLKIEIPGRNHTEVRAIAEGESFEVGDTGYRIAVEELGPYGLPFVSEGYEGAADTHARLLVQRPGPVRPIQRYALHRYPERSQDFVEGKRGDPDPSIRTAFLDKSKVQVHLVTDPPAEYAAAFENVPPDSLWVLLRVAGIAPIFSPLAEGKLPLGDPDRRDAWLHVIERYENAVPAQQPTVTPRPLRDPKLEGTYEMALLPVTVEYDLRDENHRLTGETFSRTVTLRQMPYLEQVGGEMRPQTVSVPGYGNVEIAFGRQRRQLPFAVAMTDFKMTPYPGSDIPRDFHSDLLVYQVNEDGEPGGDTIRPFQPRLNNPAIVRSPGAPLALRKIKLSQAGWDPGDPDISEADKALRDDAGRFINQQRFTILGVGNNVAIRVIALGGVLMGVGIPWAFYLKPYLMKHRIRKFNEKLKQRQAAEETVEDAGPTPPAVDLPPAASAEQQPRRELVLAADEHG